jgi:hypothetical protein
MLGLWACGQPPLTRAICGGCRIAVVPSVCSGWWSPRRVEVSSACSLGLFLLRNNRSKIQGGLQEEGAPYRQGMACLHWHQEDQGGVSLGLPLLPSAAREQQSHLRRNRIRRGSCSWGPSWVSAGGLLHSTPTLSARVFSLGRGLRGQVAFDCLPKEDRGFQRQ